MKTHPGAEMVARISRSLPCRRWQASYWLGKLLVPSRPFVGSFQSGFLEIHPGEVASSVAYFTGFYEREVTFWALDLIAREPPSLMIDVGANFGYYPILFGLASRGATRCIAFEPDPANFGWLKRNLALNASLPVRAIQMAIGDRVDEPVPFCVSQQDRSLWSRVDPSSSPPDGDQTVMVPATTLDAFTRSEEFVDVPLVLIDVEGHEAHVFQGMTEGLRRHMYKRIMVEVHPWAFASRSEIDEMISAVTRHGYEAFRFRHESFATPDKDPSYYRSGFDPSLLQPATTLELGEWEHFLFVATDVS